MFEERSLSKSPAVAKARLFYERSRNGDHNSCRKKSLVPKAGSFGMKELRAVGANLGEMQMALKNRRKSQRCRYGKGNSRNGRVNCCRFDRDTTGRAIMTRNNTINSTIIHLQTFLRSAYGIAYSESLGMLFRFLQAFPRGQRRQLFREGLLLMPCEAWSKQQEAGLARALISDGIEQLIGAPLSANALQRLGAKAADRPLTTWIAYLPLKSEWEVHVVLMELARAVLLPGGQTNSLACDSPAEEPQTPGSTQAAEHLDRAWPALPPHVRDAIWTLVHAAVPTAGVSEATAPPAAQPEESDSY